MKFMNISHALFTINYVCTVDVYAVRCTYMISAFDWACWHHDKRKGTPLMPVSSAACVLSEHR